MKHEKHGKISLSDLRIAVVHEWLVDYSGSERVVEQILNLFPQADLFAQVDFLSPNQRGFIQNKTVRTSFIQKLPFAKKKYRSYLLLMPLAVEQFDLSAYDLIISSSHAVSKGVLTGPDQVHICYCYSPMRYAWDLSHQYLRESGLSVGLKGWLAKILLHRLRLWDYRTANGVDAFVAISGYIARRIEKIYGRPSTIIFPPVSVDDFALSHEKEDFYFTASRMVPYKRIELIVEAFARMPEKKLVVIGSGPLFGQIKSKATPNVTLLGYQPFTVLRDHLQRARAFVFAAEEDFGILPVEAQACGTPVIAFGRGGARETVIEGQTGIFFESQTPEAIIDAVDRFEASENNFDAYTIRQNALRFSAETFRITFKSFVETAHAKFCEKRESHHAKRILSEAVISSDSILDGYVSRRHETVRTPKSDL